jgi:hypothetical protein
MLSMKFIPLLLFPAGVWAAQPTDQPIAPIDVKVAASKAIALIQDVGDRWPEKQSCASCHNQLLPLVAFRRAREHGVPVDEERATRMLRHSLATFRSAHDSGVSTESH